MATPPPTVPPPVIPQPPVNVEPPPPPQVKELSKLLKEARQLGCVNFSGVCDAIEAKNWIIGVTDTVVEMGLNDEDKLRVTTRFLKKEAKAWWENLKLRTTEPITWEMFLQEFDDQYYSHFHWEQKQKEFMTLRQQEKSVTKFETELRELSSFVPDALRTDSYLRSRFEEGLNLNL